MADLKDGETCEMKGSGKKPYVLKNTGGVYSCSCPAWKIQSVAIEKRTCKHIRKLRGDEAEEARLSTGPLAAVPSGPNVKETAPPLLLAEKWTEDVDPKGWWMSEKLDGVRAYWDGKRFLSRLGNTYKAPVWFTEGFPKAPLDGELWLGRKAFQRAISIVRRQDENEQWREIKYLVFDCPAESIPFERRLRVISVLAAKLDSPHLVAHVHSCCTGIEHLRKQLGQVELLGGEGLMLRKPGSMYEVGRSSTLLKVKTFHDAEAVVLAHEEGKGKHKGRLGALLVRPDNGKEFSVGSGFTDAEREDPPAVGAIITYRYQELTDGGTPRFPTFVRVCDAKE